MNKASLERHIQEQQSLACKLCGNMETLDSRHLDGVAGNAQTILIGVARSMAEQLGANLDSMALPKEGAA